MAEQDQEELSKLRKSLDSIEQRLIKVTNDLERTQIADYVNLMNKPLKLVWRSFLSGVARGVGTAVGWVFLATFILYLLQLLGALNLPIIGDYIADIVRIVQNQLDVDIR